MFERVMVPIDGSLLAEEAIATAAVIAKESGAALELARVHVAYPYELYENDRWDDEWRTEERAYLSQKAARVEDKFGIPVHTVLLEGQVVEQLCKHALETEASAIVMSTHGRTGFSRAWLGSVADGVMRKAGMPVLLLPPRAHVPPRADETHPLFRHVLIPLDGSSLAEDILPAAAALAQIGHARLTLLRCIEVYRLPAVAQLYLPEPILTDDGLDELTTIAREYLELRAAELRKRYPALEVVVQVEIGESAAAMIVDAAKVESADLIAMATHGRGATRLMIGSVADKVLRSGVSPVLLLRPRRAQTGASTDEVSETVAASAL
jgi:nucleotide-binding universal stress UspA family protein